MAGVLMNELDKCPICDAANGFEKMFHYMIYTLGLLAVEGVENDPSLEIFYNSMVLNCRRYLKSKDAKDE